jgi:hypothetical protein
LIGIFRLFRILSLGLCPLSSSEILYFNLPAESGRASNSLFIVALMASSIGGRFRVFVTGSALSRWLPGSVFIGLWLRLALAQRGSNLR